MKIALSLLVLFILFGVPFSASADVECACYNPPAYDIVFGPVSVTGDSCNNDTVNRDACETSSACGDPSTSPCEWALYPLTGTPGGSCTAPTELKILPIIGWISCNLNRVIPILMLLATVVFLWGVVRYVLAGGNEEELKSARNLMFFGVVALAVMVAVWGFANLLLEFIFGAAPIPGIPGQDAVEQATGA